MNSNQSVKYYYTTILLVAINILIYLTYGFNKINALSLLELGANFAPYTINGEYYRLVTSMFLHGSLVHLIANMYSLLFLGIYVEKNVGNLNILAIYLITGLAGSLTSANFNLFTISVGASGAIFGLYGYYIVHIIREDKPSKKAIFVNFVLYLLLTLTIGAQLNFDNYAHFGGLLMGLMLGLTETYSKKSWLYLVSTAMLLIWYYASPKDQVQYFNAYQEFISADSIINHNFNKRLDDEALYKVIKNIENTAEETILAFDTISIRQSLHADTAIIKDYLTYKDKQIDFLLKGLSKESYIYNDSIQWMGLKIRNLDTLKYVLNFNPQTPPKSDTVPQEPLTIKRQDYDSNWFETVYSDFSYVRIGQQDSLNDWNGWVQDYYADGGIQMKGNYVRGLKNGIFIYYRSDSTYESSGRYREDIRIGKWQHFDENNQLVSEIRYLQEGDLVENIWDERGQLMVEDGNGTEVYYYDDGQIRFKRTIQDGLNHGFVEAYYPNGELFYKELHENGMLIQGYSYEENHKYAYDQTTHFASPEGGLSAFYDYLEEANLWASDEIDEPVVIGFDVHYTGRIYNIRFLKRYNRKYDEYAKNLLLDGPKWEPARAHGIEKVTSYAEITVRF